MNRLLLFFVSICCIGSLHANFFEDDLFSSFEKINREMEKFHQRMLQDFERSFEELKKNTKTIENTGNKKQALNVSIQEDKNGLSLSISGVPTDLRKENIDAEVHESALFTLKATNKSFSLEMRAEGNLVRITTKERLGKDKNEIIRSSGSFAQTLSHPVDLSKTPEVILTDGMITVKFGIKTQKRVPVIVKEARKNKKISKKLPELPKAVAPVQHKIIVPEGIK